MSSFLQALEAEVSRLGLGGSRVLVGVSGGPDSVALLRGLQTVAPALGLAISAAHLNHRLRPGAAEDDARWTQELCRGLGVDLVLEETDVPGLARAKHLNVEEAARLARYDFFERTARSLGCPSVAVGHTADDRVETVLHHLLRGTGLAGLRGMPSSRPLAEGVTLVRPLLRLHRRAIESWLAEIGQDFRTDATNADEGRTRARIRHVLLPLLEREFGPQVRESLLRLAEQAGEMQSVIAGWADQLLDSCIEDDSDDLCRLKTGPLADQPRHLVREVFVRLWRRKQWPRRGMAFDDWDRLYEMVATGAQNSFILPGNIAAIRRGTLIAFCRR